MRCEFSPNPEEEIRCGEDHWLLRRCVRCEQGWAENAGGAASPLRCPSRSPRSKIPVLIAAAPVSSSPAPASFPCLPLPPSKSTISPTAVTPPAQATGPAPSIAEPIAEMQQALHGNFHGADKPLELLDDSHLTPVQQAELVKRYLALWGFSWNVHLDCGLQAPNAFFQLSARHSAADGEDLVILLHDWHDMEEDLLRGPSRPPPSAFGELLRADKWSE